MSQTVIGDILPYTQVTATAGSQIFGTNWTANFESDVVVYLTPVGQPPNDATQILVNPTDYTVTFVGSQNDVQVILIVAANAGDIITITRQTPADRENLYTNTNFTPSMLNNDFGILTLVDQQAQLVNQLIGPRYNYSAVIAPNSSFPNANIILPLLGPNQIWAKSNDQTAIVAVDFDATIPGGGSINVGIENQLAYYATSGTTLSGVANENNGVLVTSNTGVPSVSTTLPAGLTITGYATSGANSNITSLIGLTGPLEAPSGVNSSAGALLLQFLYTTGAINYIGVRNSVTSVAPTISALGVDANVSLVLNSKGTGGVVVKGFSDGAAITAGYVGQVLTVNVPNASAVNMPSTVATDITSLSLPPGNWLVFGNGFFNFSGAGTEMNVWISTTSATIPDPSMRCQIDLTTATTPFLAVNAPLLALNLSGTTIVYLSGLLGFGSGAGAGSGTLTAVRIS